jgi:hypothetical protein
MISSAEKMGSRYSHLPWHVSHSSMMLCDHNIVNIKTQSMPTKLTVNAAFGCRDVGVVSAQLACRYFFCEVIAMCLDRCC